VELLRKKDLSKLVWERKRRRPEARKNGLRLDLLIKENITEALYLHR
jgi:hypothetical protein